MIETFAIKNGIVGDDELSKWLNNERDWLTVRDEIYRLIGVNFDVNKRTYRASAKDDAAIKMCLYEYGATREQLQIAANETRNTIGKLSIEYMKRVVEQLIVGNIFTDKEHEKYKQRLI